MESAIKKALASLDDLGDGAIKKHILGLGGDDEAMESPAEEAGEGLAVEAAEGDDMPEDLKAKLMELLSK